MTRRDHLYDRLIIVDWNISRRAQQRGSAIFVHQARLTNGQMQPTEGCIALEAQTFARLASRLARLKAITVL
jgi:L,D-peptidoglycan transpeptidase YkuD (ErfK/YbiS/YcfS/YnhG family)